MGGMLPSHERLARANTHASALRYDAWPTLVADTDKKRLESHHVHPSNHDFARTVSVAREHANDPLALLIVGTDGGNHCKTIYQLSPDLMCFATCIAACGSISFPLRRISALRWGYSLVIQLFEQLNCNSAKKNKQTLGS